MFRQWSDGGIRLVKDLYKKKQFASFAQLQTKFNLPPGQFFRYLQIRNIVSQSVALFHKLPLQHNFYELLRKPSASKHQIFVSLFSRSTPSTHIKDAWMADAGTEIPTDLWDRVLGGIKLTPVNARLQVIQFKVIHHLHYSKTRLNRVFPYISPVCDKCKASNGTLGHLYFFLS